MNPRETVELVAGLRDSMSQGRRPSWRVPAGVSFDPTLLCHLPPPCDSELPGWTEKHAYGLHYYRKGPAFFTIKDLRREEASQSILLDDPQAVPIFESLTGVVDVNRASADVATLVNLLDAERMIFRSERWVTLLPYRMRRWPVPCNAV
ncbi:DUF5825 family protein [Micromonospora sp. NPDC004336]